jgi:hypothetical protein
MIHNELDDEQAKYCAVEDPSEALRYMELRKTVIKLGFLMTAGISPNVIKEIVKGFNETNCLCQSPV